MSHPRRHNSLHYFLLSAALIAIVSTTWHCEYVSADETFITDDQQSERPNLIFIFTDDQRMDAVGAYGNSRIKTPNLDRLAARGVRFTQAHPVMSLCSPSRAAALTGCYGSRNGVTALGGPLAPGMTTFAQLLGKAGYRTGVVGKWHIEDQPQDVGFDFHSTFWSNGTYFGRPVNDNGTRTRPKRHVDDFCMDRSIEFLHESIANDKKRPFVLFHATQLPHMDHRHSWPSPPEVRQLYNDDEMPLPSTWEGDLTGKPPYLAEVRNRTQAQAYGYDQPKNIRRHIGDYYAVITEMDQILGRMFDELDRLDLWKNTWVIFMSDNGWLLGEHGMTSKVLQYDPSIRVPMIIAGPGIQPRTDDRITLNIDIAPTLLDLAGVNVPETMDGQSMKPLLLSDGQPVETWRKQFVYECIGGYGGTRPMLGVINDRYKLVHTWDDAKDIGTRPPAFVELYDLKNDPEETSNLAGDGRLSDVQQEMAEAIQQHIEWLER